MIERGRTEAEERLRHRVRKYRQGANLTLADLASKASLSADAVAKIEAGERSPRLNTIVSLSDALGVRVADLVDEQESDVPAEVFGLVEVVRGQPREVRKAVLQVARLFVETPRAADSAALEDQRAPVTATGTFG